jgi:hypothetical protein
MNRIEEKSRKSVRPRFARLLRRAAARLDRSADRSQYG